MWWPWRWHRHVDDDGARAKAESKRKLDEARARDPEIGAITDRLEQMRRQNRFAAMIEQALRDHR